MAKRATNPLCPVCHTQQFSVGEYVTLSVTNVPGASTLGGPSYPCIAFICNNCGDVQLVNLLAIGFTNEDFQSLTLPPFPQEKSGG
jgi:hypothetical protein